ncbi:hypothetical protein QFC20_007869 [Naganishia adeliensis]|uniref:Uncharacterized protein n=1 Tax=Naganishia adeliensis TaxID=92952 RepID=A0ACC2UUX1_9TREE|nr:hypothetical protein QFC20_007869 [Naganishia adeliensis]
MANKKYHKPVKKTRKPPITRQEPPRNSTTNPAAAAAIRQQHRPRPASLFNTPRRPSLDNPPHTTCRRLSIAVFWNTKSRNPSSPLLQPFPGPTPDPDSSESSVRNVPPAVFELVVLENLHPENHRLDASALARVNRGRYQLLRSIINKVLVSREQKGKSRRDLDVEFERMMKTDGKGGLVSTVVNLFSPSDSASMFRWLSEVVNATTRLRPAGSGTAPSSTKPVIDHITVLTHFDFSSDGGLLPSTSSSIFVPHTGPTVQDAVHQSYRSTDFGDTAKAVSI